MSAQCEVTMKRVAVLPMSTFERYLSLWVFICIVAGIAFGQALPGVFQAIGGMEVAQVNLPRRLHGPAALAVAAGAIWIAEADAHAVLRFDPLSGELSEVPIEG